MAALVLKECPFCHKVLVAQLVSKEEVDTGEILSQNDVIFRRAFLRSRAQGIAERPEAFITYELTYRCKSCRKEWSRTPVKEIGLPKEYVENGEEKTEYDADKEAEQAREEGRERLPHCMNSGLETRRTCTVKTTLARFHDQHGSCCLK
jgi:hypothetical protein